MEDFWEYGRGSAGPIQGDPNNSAVASIFQSLDAIIDPALAKFRQGAAYGPTIKNLEAMEKEEAKKSPLILMIAVVILALVIRKVV